MLLNEEKTISYLRTENLKNHTLSHGTYLYSTYMGVPSPGAENKITGIETQFSLIKSDVYDMPNVSLIKKLSTQLSHCMAEFTEHNVTVVTFM